MAVQTTYDDRHAIGYEGQLADMGHRDIITKLAETNDTGFGLAVIQGTGDDQAKIGAAGEFVGITCRDVTLPADNLDKYKTGENMSIMRQGVMFVTAVDAVVPGDAVYRSATGALSKTAAGNTLIDGATWRTTTAAGDIGKIRIA